jgi:beta-glucosidase-like glycosyl hydrolase
MSDLSEPGAAIADRVADLLARMTAAEKIAQLGAWFAFRFVGPDGAVDGRRMAEIVPDGIGQISGAALIGGDDPRRLLRNVDAIQRFLVEETRLGIPAIVHNEALCGFMYGPATSFPTAINLAATWQPELARGMADVARRQMLATGVRQALSPVLDVARDARWGRVHETYGEDPVLCAAFGVAFVEGLQGDDLRDGVIATGKHFLGYGLSEGALNQAAVHLGPRALYEVFALPFEAAIREAGLASIMNSYSEIDGVPVAASPEVLNGLLRNELAFDGFVVADYGSIAYNLTKHFVAADEREAALLSLAAGIDVELPELRCYPALPAALADGELAEEMLDAAVARVLEAKFRLGLFEQPYGDEDDVVRAFVPTPGVDLGREIAARSLVLLENDGVLPLAARHEKIAVVGPFADSLRLMFAAYTPAAADELNRYMAAGLSGSMAGVDIAGIDIDTIGEVIFGIRERGIPDAEIEAAVRRLYPEMPTLLEALRPAPRRERDDAAGKAAIEFRRGCHFLDRYDSEIESAVVLAKKSDVVICALGEKTGWVGQATGGEGRDRSSLRLPGLQADLLHAVCAAGVPVVLVLFGGRPLAIDELEWPPAAVLWAGAPGVHGPAAIADVLLGRAQPGGKLPISFPRGAGAVPVYAAAKSGSGETAAGYVDSQPGPRWAFGHGLGYTSFRLSDLSLDPPVALADETVSVDVSVENTGPRAGSEVVQLYVRDRQASVTRPLRQLAGFLRVDLQPGEKRTVRFHLAVAQLALLDRHYRLVVEPGIVDVMVGTASDRLDLSAALAIDGDVTELEARGPFWADAAILEDR